MREFRLLPWRDSLVFRNDLVRSTALSIIDSHIGGVDEVLGDLKSMLSYLDMTKKDRDLFRQYAHFLRTIANDWAFLSAGHQSAFRAGHLPPSAAAFLIKAARKKAQ